MASSPRQAYVLALVLAVLALVYYFREQIAVAALDTAGKYWPLPAAGEPYRALIGSASISSGVPFDLIARELWQESRFRADAKNAASGALGIAQFEPPTARDLGIDPLDPTQAIPAMAKYLASVRSYIDNQIDPPVTWAMTLAGYDDGEGRVSDLVNQYGDQWLVHMKPETQKYVGQILTDVPLEPLPAGALT